MTGEMPGGRDGSRASPWRLRWLAVRYWDSLRRWLRRLAPKRARAAPRHPAGARAVGRRRPPRPRFRSWWRSIPVTRPRSRATPRRCRSRGPASDHHFLTVAQFRARFAPSDQRIAAVEGSLRAHGLAQGSVTANGLIIPVRTSAGHLASAFGTSFQQVKLAGGRTAYAEHARAAVRRVRGRPHPGGDRARHPDPPARPVARVTARIRRALRARVPPTRRRPPVARNRARRPPAPRRDRTPTPPTRSPAHTTSTPCTATATRGRPSRWRCSSLSRTAPRTSPPTSPANRRVGQHVVQLDGQLSRRHMYRQAAARQPGIRIRQHGVVRDRRRDPQQRRDRAL